MHAPAERVAAAALDKVDGNLRTRAELAVAGRHDLSRRFFNTLDNSNLKALTLLDFSALPEDQRERLVKKQIAGLHWLRDDTEFLRSVIREYSSLRLRLAAVFIIEGDEEFLRQVVGDATMPPSLRSAALCKFDMEEIIHLMERINVPNLIPILAKSDAPKPAIAGLIQICKDPVLKGYDLGSKLRIEINTVSQLYTGFGRMTGDVVAVFLLKANDKIEVISWRPEFPSSVTYVGPGPVGGTVNTVVNLNRTVSRLLTSLKLTSAELKTIANSGGSEILRQEASALVNLRR